MVFEVRSRRQWGVVCTECGCVYDGRWRPLAHETQRDLTYANKYGCRICRDRTIRAALPEHHRHADEHPSHNGGWPCCGANQLGLVGPDECAACGEPYPCEAARTEDEELAYDLIDPELIHDYIWEDEE